MSHPLSKYLTTSKRINYLNVKTGSSSHSSHPNLSVVSDPEKRNFIHDGDGIPQEATWERSILPWRSPSGTIFKFPYQSSDSQGRANKDNYPIVIYLNHNNYDMRYNTTGWGDSLYDNNAGAQFFTGISVRYVDLELALALSRIIKNKGHHVNYETIQNIDKYIAYSTYRMYYRKNIPEKSVEKLNITKLEY